MLSLVLPTYNEAENLPEILPKMKQALRGIPHEIIIVDDDSPDGTWRRAQELALKLQDVHVVRRVGRRGLSSAVIEGFLAAKGTVLAVMDADGQHDFQLLLKLFEAVRGGAHFAIGSRYVEGGSVVGWDERRYALSRLATKLAIYLCKVQVQDPMSGFFAIDRRMFEVVLPRLNPKGFKILLDLLVHAPQEVRVREFPFTFGKRLHGESKLSRRVQIEFLEYLYDVTIGTWVPLTFVKYCIVGALGVVVHVATYLTVSTLLAQGVAITLFGFSVAVLSAIETAIIFNFILNNLWTFAQARLRGLSALWGFVKFNAACAVGAVANYGVAAFLFSRGWAELLAVIIGAFVGVVWNYTMNRLITWKGS